MLIRFNLIYVCMYMCLYNDITFGGYQINILSKTVQIKLWPVDGKAWTDI